MADDRAAEAIHPSDHDHPHPVEGPLPPAAGQRPASPRRTCLTFGLIGGCGCLVIIAIVAMFAGGLAWFTTKLEPPKPVPQTGQPGATIEPAPEEPAEPGLEAAMLWAATRRPDWQATVVSHSPDWLRARLAMKPTGSGEWTTWLEVNWNASSEDYELVDEGPIAAEDDPASGLQGPSEAAAIRAALEQTLEPTWVAKVQEHSSDWRRVTVWTGPPDSEWVYKVVVEWDDGLHAYVMQHMGGVDDP